MSEKTKLELNGRTIFITGGAGFIGASLIMRLLKEMKAGTILNIDSTNDYYDSSLKKYRLEQIEEAAKSSPVEYVFIKGNIADNNLLRNTFTNYKPSIVVNLAAQSGISYSIDHPDTFLENNIIGFYGILQSCRFSKVSGHPGVEHLIYASSSYVYGANEKVPFSTGDKTDYPVSLYAATKKTDELLAYSYSKMYGVAATGLRLFSVYGPAGRPDMFYYSAAESLAKGENVQLTNNGNNKMDYTYIDDVVEGIVRVMKNAPAEETGEDGFPIAPYSIYNIGKGKTETQADYLKTLQEELVNAGVLTSDFDLTAHTELMEKRPEDVLEACADVKAFEEDFGFKPETTIQEGLKKFADWYKEYSK